MQKKGSTLIFASLQLLVMCAVLFFVFDHRREVDEIYATFDVSSPKVKGSKTHELPYQVSGSRLEFDFTNYTCAKGTVVPSSDYIEVGSPFSGMIETVHVKAGDKVEIGDPLFSLNTEQLEMKKSALEADLRAETAKLKVFHQNHSKSLLDMQSLLESTQAKYLAAHNKFQVYEKLIHSKAISQLEYDDQKMIAETLSNTLKRYEGELAKLKQTAVTPELEVQRALIDKKKSELNQLEWTLTHSTIKAQESGTIYNCFMHRGDVVERGKSALPILRMGREDPLHVKVSLPESAYWKLKKRGKNIKAHVVLRSNPAINTKLEFVEMRNHMVPTSWDGNRSQTDSAIELIFSFEKGDQKILVGQSVDVFLETKGILDSYAID